MPIVELRQKFGEKTEGDMQVTVTEKTFDYLMTLPVPQARVSTYLDRDWMKVEKEYAELFLSDDCAFRFKITQVIPGSKTRWSVTLPDEMKEGEQLTLLVDRKPNSLGFSE